MGMKAAGAVGDRVKSENPHAALYRVVSKALLNYSQFIFIVLIDDYKMDI